MHPPATHLPIQFIHPPSIYPLIIRVLPFSGLLSVWRKSQLPHPKRALNFPEAFGEHLPVVVVTCPLLCELQLRASSLLLLPSCPCFSGLFQSPRAVCPKCGQSSLPYSPRLQWHKVVRDNGLYWRYSKDMVAPRRDT